MDICKNKSAVVRELVLRAWRERWSELEWGIQIKRILPRWPMSGDAYNLSDAILQPALVGPTPNSYMINYLKQSLSSQALSYASVLESIAKFDELSRQLCMKKLLKFLNEIMHKISCYSTAEDCITLTRRLVTLIDWLLRYLLRCLVQPPDNKLANICVQNVELCCHVIDKITKLKPLMWLVYIGRLEEIEIWSRVEQQSKDIKTTFQAFSETSICIINQSLRVSIDRCVSDILKLPNVKYIDEPKPKSLIARMPVCPMLNVLTFTEAIQNATCDVQVFVEQLLLVQKFQDLSRQQLFTELIRSSFLGLLDSVGGGSDLKWAAFTYLKVPQILIRLKASSGGVGFTDPGEDLAQGIDQLIRFTIFLDSVDVKCNCDCIELLLQQLSRCNLIHDCQVSALSERRRSTSQKNNSKLLDPPPGNPNTMLILRAEQTVTNILKSFDAEISKTQEGLLGVLSHMLSGKSFELILAAAAATGKLHKFATKLIKFNEISKQIGGEGTKTSQIRALLFDISFLMLCRIAQLYGVDMVLSAGASSDSFFEMWIVQYYSDPVATKPNQQSIKPDPTKVDQILAQLHGGSEIKTSLAKWHELCANIPYALLEVSNAWEYDILSQEKVQRIVDSVKTKLCCLVVCIAAWLQAYINTTPHHERPKLQALLQMLITPTSSEATMQYYTERSHIMTSIIRKMCSSHLTSNIPSVPVPCDHAIAVVTSGSFSFNNKGAAFSEFAPLFQGCIQKGWISEKELLQFTDYLNVAGPFWFIQSLLQVIQKLRQEDNIDSAIGMSYSLLQMDTDQVALVLLRHIIPNILSDPRQWNMLHGHHGIVLVKFTVWCITASFTCQGLERVAEASKSKDALVKLRGRKRTRNGDLEELYKDCRDDSCISKLRKLLTTADDDTITHIPGSGFNFDICSSSMMAMSSVLPTDPLTRSVVALFRLFSAIINEQLVTPPALFIKEFVLDTLRNGEPISHSILQCMPISMISQLTLSSGFNLSPGMSLGMCDLSTAIGRKIGAKVLCHSKKLQQQT